MSAGGRFYRFYFKNFNVLEGKTAGKTTAFGAKGRQNPREKRQNPRERRQKPGETHRNDDKNRAICTGNPHPQRTDGLERQKPSGPKACMGGVGGVEGPGGRDGLERQKPSGSKREGFVCNPKNDKWRAVVVDTSETTGLVFLSSNGRLLYVRDYECKSAPASKWRNPTI
jgi:hypothetical protein